MSHDAQRMARDTGKPGRSLQVQPSGAALGAEVHGIDLREIDDETFGRFIAPGWITRCCSFATSS